MCWLHNCSNSSPRLELFVQPRTSRIISGLIIFHTLWQILWHDDISPLFWTTFVLSLSWSRCSLSAPSFVGNKVKQHSCTTRPQNNCDLPTTFHLLFILHFITTPLIQATHPSSRSERGSAGRSFYTGRAWRGYQTLTSRSGPFHYSSCKHCSAGTDSCMSLGLSPSWTGAA